MIRDHLNDSEIQLCTLDENECSVEALEHFRLCEECKAKGKQYSSIFAGLKYQENPAFDFDFSDLVMRQLPSREAKNKFDNYFVFSAAAATIFLAGLTIYLYSTYIPAISLNIEPLSFSLILLTVVSVLLILCGDLIAKFHKQMKVLNFY